jgi:type II secretory pathway predicted ATPase ExeA
MYERHFGLERKPFSLQPDPSFMYLGRRHKLALHLLQYGLLEETGFIVVTGEIGAGKTTLIQYLMGGVRDEVVTGIVHHTHAHFGTIMRSIAHSFDVHVEGDNQRLYEAFVDRLEELYDEGKRGVLIIDEAQNLSIETLEELRMLSNVNSGERFLLQVILVGQPQLLEMMQRPELVQLVQRVGISYHLDTFELDETSGTGSASPAARSTCSTTWPARPCTISPTARRV